jgi:hypothetical protein
MKTSPVPKICGFALAALFAAGFSHWWSVNQFVSAFGGGMRLPEVAPAVGPETPAAGPSAAPATLQQLVMKHASPAIAANSDPSQKAFYEALVARMERIQNENRDLLDQVAETNRDVMKLEFRVDTHSESFRPMPISEDLYSATSFDDGPGVLPPRAEPVFLPGEE